MREAEPVSYFMRYGFAKVVVGETAAGDGGVEDGAAVVLWVVSQLYPKQNDGEGIRT